MPQLLLLVSSRLARRGGKAPNLGEAEGFVHDAIARTMSGVRVWKQVAKEIVRDISRGPEDRFPASVDGVPPKSWGGGPKTSVAQAPLPEQALMFVHLEWLIEEPVPDPDAILYEVLPYSPHQADRIIRQLCVLAGFDIGRDYEDTARAQAVRQAFRMIVDAALERQALLDLEAIERELGKPAWRDRLRALRHDRRQFIPAIRDKSARAALRWALVDLGGATRAGRRWLHYLRDHPVVLRKVVDRALEARMLQRDQGRTDRYDRVLLIRGVGRAYELLTGRRFGRSVTSETLSRPGGEPTGPGLRLALLCLQPLDPDVTDDAVVWTIRHVQAAGLP